MATAQASAATAASNSGGATAAVLAHHLGAFAQGIDAVLSDYTDSSVLITHDRAFRGLSEIRSFFQAFMDSATAQFWDAFELTAQGVEGNIAYITWRSEPAVRLATDTLLIRDGKIAVQTFTSYTA